MNVRIWVALIVCLTPLCAGCAGFKPKSDGSDTGLLSWFQKEDSPDNYAEPASMVATWKSSVFEKPGKESLRGFGGRFYFYDARNEPVRVEGELTIYGYHDDPANENNNTKADRKFVFEANTLQDHYSDSGLGPSYSFWVPWEPIGGEEKTITLIPVFRSKRGAVPVSEPITVLLDGKRRPIVDTNKSNPFGPGTKVIKASATEDISSYIQQAGFDADDLAAKHRKTTTIRLPNHLIRTFQPNRQLAEAKAEKNDTPSANTTATVATTASAQTASQSVSPLKPVGRLAQRLPEAGSNSTSGGSRPKSRRVFGQPGAF